MKNLFYILIIILHFNNLIAQSVKIPIEKRKGHLYSQWKLNNSIDANIFLESGFPIIVLSEQFASKYSNELSLKLIATDDEYVSLWNSDNKYKVLYHINDTLIINGVIQILDAIVVDFSEIEAWNDYDIIYPISDLKGKIEINIKEEYMRLLDTLNDINDFNVYEVKKDKNTKGLYMKTTLIIYDTLMIKETLTGKFLLDLGAGNAIILNKNLKTVEKFVEKSDRMILKDTTRIATKGKNNLSIIIPHKIELSNIIIESSFIAAMKYNSTRSANKYVGIIGNSFFENFTAIFDFDNNKLYLKPNSEK